MSYNLIIFSYILCYFDIIRQGKAINVYIPTLVFYRKRINISEIE